jgi:acetyl-CoA decarbonylase/synthase complex subunit epsilon
MAMGTMKQSSFGPQEYYINRCCLRLKNFMSKINFKDRNYIQNATMSFGNLVKEITSSMDQVIDFLS